jgi:hypothetical protein
MPTKRSQIAVLACVPLSVLTPVILSAAASAAVGIHAVDWGDVSVPGAVCHAPHAIRLHQGSATINAPAGLGTSRVVARETTVVFGRLQGAREDAAAVNVSCSTPGGTADGELADSWVIYRSHGSALRILGTLAPEQPAETGLPHVPYFDVDSGGITLHRGTITVRELWYATGDATCCPSETATTVWAVGPHGKLTATSTTPSTRTGTGS